MFRYWLPLVLYSAVILFLSSRTSSELPSIDLPDKLVHFFEYFVFGALLFRSLRRAGITQEAPLWLACILVLIAFALLDETVQSFTPTRNKDWADGAADLAGGITGGLLYRWVKDYWKQRGR